MSNARTSQAHLALRALCEGAVMVALAQILGYLKLYELPQGGSITVGSSLKGTVFTVTLPVRGPLEKDGEISKGGGE